MNPLNFINEQLESTLSDTWLDSTLSRCYLEFNEKKEGFLREKLVEKGFGHLVEGMGKRKFPKVMCISQGGWDYYYADNDTDEGAFIVAITKVTASIDEVGQPYQLKIEMQWQDKFPLVGYKKESNDRAGIHKRTRINIG